MFKRDTASGQLTYSVCWLMHLFVDTSHFKSGIDHQADAFHRERRGLSFTKQPEASVSLSTNILNLITKCRKVFPVVVILHWEMCWQVKSSKYLVTYSLKLGLHWTYSSVTQRQVSLHALTFVLWGKMRNNRKSLKCLGRINSGKIWDIILFGVHTDIMI